MDGCDEQPGNSGLFQSQLERLGKVADEILQCIQDEEWEKLTIALELRQQYLEYLFSEPVPDEYQDVVKKIAGKILEQDAVSILKVQQHIEKAEKLQVLYERGKRVIQAYEE